jgi:hypothetical protein
MPKKYGINPPRKSTATRGSVRAKAAAKTKPGMKKAVNKIAKATPYMIKAGRAKARSAMRRGAAKARRMK